MEEELSGGRDRVVWAFEKRGLTVPGFLWQWEDPLNYPTPDQWHEIRVRLGLIPANEEVDFL